MPNFRRLIAVAIGFVVPVALAGAADAAPRHHRPAHVRTATYKVTQHKVVRHRHASRDARRVAQAQHRHTNMRGS